MLRLASCLFVLTLLGCDAGRDSVTPQPEGAAYRITDGGCGRVVFAEPLASDLDSAIDAVEDEKVEQFGAGAVRVEPYQLGVADKDGNTPADEFWALRVLDAVDGTHLHSVHEVVTTGGDLYYLDWCPD
jgi:hypothetical protein